MASCYVALVSLQTTIHSILNHPNPPVSLQNHQAQSLLRKLICIQQFLELHSHREDYPTDDFKNEIRDVVHAVEDVIEKSTVGGSYARYLIQDPDEYTHTLDYLESKLAVDIFLAIEDMDAIVNEILEDKEKPGDDDEHQQLVSSVSSLPLASPSVGKKTAATVEFDDVLVELLHMLTGQRSSSRQIIPITGMAGIGRTTLAPQAYRHSCVVNCFDVRVWVTISQNFRVGELLLNILGQLFEKGTSMEVFNEMNQARMCETIYKHLMGRRYLIVLDDTWGIDEELSRIIRLYFPNEKNGSRIIITSRVSNVVVQLSNTSGIQMNLLDYDRSWKLFCETVFQGEVCPIELEEIGKTIARNCKGLPLSIVVIGGFLAKSKQTKQHWEYVARNLSSIVNLEDDERCLKILYMSYKHLPIHLKPCFLYMGIYPEDSKIRVSWLVKLLVAEGFLKPVSGKFMEVVAKEYIKELADRNLISVDEWGSTGTIKFCRIHDVLRDLCKREAQKDRFLYFVGEHNHNTTERDECNSNRPRRIVVERKMVKEECPSEAPNNMSQCSASNARSLISNIEEGRFPSPSNCCLLRILKLVDKRHPMIQKNFGVIDGDFEEDMILKCFNSRYLAIGLGKDWILPSSISLLWNLETLILNLHPDLTGVMAPIEIWKMPQLRHLRISKFVSLPNPPDDNFVLWNLQTVSTNIDHFKCSEEVVKKIPNIRKLDLYYFNLRTSNDYCLNNLELLHKMESLKLGFRTDVDATQRVLSMKITFPQSLKKLVLLCPHLDWQHVAAMTGALPNLEKLQLFMIAGIEWRSTEGQFLRLKCLRILDSKELISWTVDDHTHFPLLERLTLQNLPNLEEVPSSIGEVPNLQTMHIFYCRDSCVVSAQKIAEEEEGYRNSKLLVSVILDQKNEELESLASPNFTVIHDYPGRPRLF